LKLIITKHARDIMFERGIDENQIVRTIQYGARTKQTDGYIAAYTYLRVAFKKLSEEVYKIKTVIVE
jgi:hypothetical protein